MRTLVCCICLLAFFYAPAQKVIDVSKNDGGVGNNLFYSVGGEPFINAKFVSLVEGTPYFKDTWLRSTLTTPDGQIYKNVSIKLDLYDNQLHYQDPKGEERVSTTAVKQAVLQDGGQSYTFVYSPSLPTSGNALKEGWYQQLATGTAGLYKAYKKIMSENKPYGSATVEQRIQTRETYYVYYNNVFLELKKIKDVPEVLANKKAELEAFLKEKDDKTASMDERFAAVINYYNSLFKDQK